MLPACPSPVRQNAPSPSTSHPPGRTSFQGAVHTRSPRRPPLLPQAHPRGWQATLRRHCSCKPVPACPRGHGWAPCLPVPIPRSGVSSSSALPTPSRLWCVLGERGMGPATFSPVPLKNFKVRLWPDLNCWIANYWLQGLGDEHSEGGSETCTLAPVQSH